MFGQRRLRPGMQLDAPSSGSLGAGNRFWTRSVKDMPLTALFSYCDAVVVWLVFHGKAWLAAGVLTCFCAGNAGEGAGCRAAGRTDPRSLCSPAA